MKFKNLIIAKQLKIYFTNRAFPVSNLYNNTEVIAYETTIRIISVQ